MIWPTFVGVALKVYNLLTCLQSDYFGLDIICRDNMVLVVTGKVSEQFSTISYICNSWLCVWLNVLDRVWIRSTFCATEGSNASGFHDLTIIYIAVPAVGCKENIFWQ